MAEYGAHLTSATASDRPSFFEVLAQESLMATLRPALKYLIKILADHNPVQYGVLYRYSGEIYSSLDLLLQHHFLSTRSASFAENFYSLKRVPAVVTDPPQSTTQGLQAWQHVRSLLCLVLVPYLKLKLEALFERWRDEALDRPQWQERHRLRRIFMAVFPFIHMTWESTLFLYQLRYLFHKSDCHSPFLKLAGVRLRYMSKEDIMEQMQGSVMQTDMSSWRATLYHYFKKVVGVLAVSISQGLSVGIFFLQFLEWWYMSQDTQTRLAVTALPIPKPPKIKEKEGGTLPDDPRICPLCQKPRTNDTALSTSGKILDDQQNSSLLREATFVQEYGAHHVRSPSAQHPSHRTFKAQQTRIEPLRDLLIATPWGGGHPCPECRHWRGVT